MRSLSAIEIQKSWWPCEGHATLKVPHIADRLASMKSVYWILVPGACRHAGNPQELVRSLAPDQVIQEPCRTTFESCWTWQLQIWPGLFGAGSCSMRQARLITIENYYNLMQPRETFSARSHKHWNWKPRTQNFDELRRGTCLQGTLTNRITKSNKISDPCHCTLETAIATAEPSSRLSFIATFIVAFIVACIVTFIVSVILRIILWFTFKFAGPIEKHRICAKTSNQQSLAAPHFTTGTMDAHRVFSECLETTQGSYKTVSKREEIDRYCMNVVCFAFTSAWFPDPSAPMAGQGAKKWIRHGIKGTSLNANALSFNSSCNTQHVSDTDHPNAFPLKRGNRKLLDVIR